MQDYAERCVSQTYGRKEAKVAVKKVLHTFFTALLASDLRSRSIKKYPRPQGVSSFATWVATTRVEKSSVSHLQGPAGVNLVLTFYCYHCTKKLQLFTYHIS